ncbi:MAG: sulfatase-like hydrolase/transferase [Verrucomicrobiae bacterium]|nr:sulfatase-like hydrolase/transferase [Verrucomicrobiae bacterium]
MCALTGTILTSSAAAPRPNILYFYLDDFGWGGLGPNGQTALKNAGQAHLITPNLDRLADEGVNFQRAYGCTVCSPARASQQTGFHNGHAYADRNNTDNARKAMRAEDVTMGDALSTAGYTTGFWGKWGFGGSDDHDNPVLVNLQTLPNNHGYQYILAELHHVRAHTFFQPTLWKFAPGDSQIALVPNSLAAYQNNPAYPDTPALQNDPTYPATAYCDDSYSFAALDFVRQQGQNYNATGQPFFALFSVQTPHTPYGDIATLPDWDAAYADAGFFSGLSTNAQQYAAMVTRIDAHIGNLLDALEDPNHDGDTSDSVADQTIVVFQSDNGGQNSLMNQNANLRGYKGSIWEGGIRIPMLVRWPDKIKPGATLEPGTNTQMVVDVTDMLPTFCELAGQEIPLGIDGVSIAPTLTGAGGQIARDFIIHEALPNSSIIRGKWKLVRTGADAYQLYDLEADPAEADDLAGVPENAELVAELATLLLGERVTEPAWFAPSYHQWTGADEETTNEAGHWSDYSYADLGGVYQTETGAPQLSWIARMAHDNTAVADADLELLALDLSSPDTPQVLDMGAHKLTGRNEIRIGGGNTIRFDNGTVSSLRRISIAGGGVLSGAGHIEGTLANGGTVEVTMASASTGPGPDIEVPGPDVTLTDGMDFVSNGGFEQGTDTGGGDYSYSTLVDWSTDGSDASLDGAKPGSPHSGTMRGLIQAGYPLVQKTAYPVHQGDSYTVSFWHRGFSGWNTGETAEVRVFYIDAEGGRVDLLQETFAMTNGTWIQANHTIPAVALAAAEGRALHILLGAADGTGFASFDDVSIIRHGDEVTIPGPLTWQPGPDITVAAHRRLEIDGAFAAGAGSTLRLTIAGQAVAGEDYGKVGITGDATLAGTLEVIVDPAFQPEADQAFTILSADAVSGTFANDGDVVTGSDGTRFSIGYSATDVTLTMIGTTAQGTPYDWLEGHGIDGGDPEAADLIDHDKDGALAWEEYLAGTDPTDPGSVFRASSTVSEDGGNLVLTWPSAAGRTYQIQDSGNLDGFGFLAGPFAATPPWNSEEVPIQPGVSRFFRVLVNLE